jgi:hypothetical protein
VRVPLSVVRVPPSVEARDDDIRDLLDEPLEISVN